MKRVLGALLVLVFGVSAQWAHAGDYQAVGYIGANYAILEQDDRFFGEEDFDTGELIGRIGGHVNKYFAGEMRVGSTIGPEESKDGSVEFVHQYYYTGLIRLQYPMGALTPYLVAGYSKINEEISTSSSSTSASFSDTSAGIGTDIGLGQRWGINLEYFQLSDKDDVARKGASFGLFLTFE